MFIKKICFLLVLSITITNQAFSQFTLLDEAYKEKSQKKLDDFFELWRREIPPISDNQFLNLSDTSKEAYNVFKAFYNSRLNNIDKLESNDDRYKNVSYLIIQPKLPIRIQNKVYYTIDEKKTIYEELLSKYGKDSLDILRLSLSQFPEEDRDVEELYGNDFLFIDTIAEFRPDISFTNKQKAVYLTLPYEIGLTFFLGSQIDRNNERLHYTTYLPLKTINSRKKFLEHKIKIYKGHWGAYWQLITYPEVQIIIFDKEMQYAKIYFRIVYEGGEAILKKEEDKWIIQSSQITWVE